MHIIEFFYYHAAFNAPCVGHKDGESQAHDESQFVREQNYPIGRALGLLMKHTEGQSTIDSVGLYVYARTYQRAYRTIIMSVDERDYKSRNADYKQHYAIACSVVPWPLLAGVEQDALL